MSYQVNPYNGNLIPVGVKRIVRQTSPTANDYQYPEGTQWLDDPANTVYFLADVTGTTATWKKIASSDFGNIHITGNTISSTDTNGNVNITPHGSGDLVLDGQKFPQADGSADQILKTDGSNQLSWVDASGGSDGFSLGYTAGEYYTSILFGDFSNETLGTNRVNYIPYYIKTDTTFTGITIYNVVAQAAGKNCRLGIYEDNGGTPGALILDAGEVDMTVTGILTIVIDQVLPQGWIWLACAGEADGTLRGASNTKLLRMLGTNCVSTLFGRRDNAYPYGALPDPAIVSTSIQGSLLIWLSVS